MARVVPFFPVSLLPCHALGQRGQGWQQQQWRGVCENEMSLAAVAYLPPDLPTIAAVPGLLDPELEGSGSSG